MARIKITDIPKDRKLSREDLKLVRGGAIATAVSSVSGSNTVPYYAYEMKNVIVTGYSFSGSAGSDPAPMETVTMNYDKVEWDYNSQDGSGSGDGGASGDWEIESGS